MVVDGWLRANFRESVGAWDDARVPLEQRGVRREWLIGCVQSLQERLSGARPASVLTTHSFVREVVKPLTRQARAPLYWLVPEEHRGRPTTFVSHAWQSLMAGPRRQRIGAMDALSESPHEYVWIDFACYNQHTFEAIATDMLRVIEAIGEVSVCATPTPLYTRAWCLWELLCAHRAGAKIDLLVNRGYRNDKVLAVNTIYRSFNGVSAARATAPEDRETILRAVLEHFGSERTADAELDRLIRDRLSSDWHELGDRSGPMRFSPTPWVAGGAGVAPAAYRPYYLPELLDAVDYRTNTTVLEIFAESGVYLGPELERLAAAKKAGDATGTATDVDRALTTELLLRELEALKASKGAAPSSAPSATASPTARRGRGTDWFGTIANYVALGATAAVVWRFGWIGLPVALIGWIVLVQVVRRVRRGGTGGAGSAGRSTASASADERPSPLTIAAGMGQFNVVEYLHQQGDPIEDGVGRRYSPLREAARGGHLFVVRYLLGCGAAVDAAGHDGATALQLAAHHGHDKVVNILLRAGANPCRRGLLRLTAAEAARKGGFDALADMIEREAAVFPE